MTIFGWILDCVFDRQYSEAADRMAVAMMATSECLMGSLDVKIMGRGIGLGSLPGGALGSVFGWFSPGQGAIPSANLSLQSSSDKVMRRVAKDIDRFATIAFWVRLAGFIMSLVTIFIILAKATYYTAYHIQWKPGTVGLAIRVIEGLRVIAIYTILRSTVYFQKYITERACEVNVNNTVIETPFCEVVGEECEFQCTSFQQNYTSPCAECEIPYTPPWEDLWTWANFLGIVYLVFIAIVIIVELREAKSQGSELQMAQERAEMEEELRHQRKVEKKRRKAKELAEASAYVPPKSRQGESSRTRHRDDEDKPRKHKSKHKSKHKHRHRRRKEESSSDGENLV